MNLFLLRVTVTAVSLGAPGEAEKPCILSLVDDTLYEEGEELRLVLGSPRSEARFGGLVGALNETLVKIKDTADSEYGKRRGWYRGGGGGVGLPITKPFGFRARHPLRRNKVQHQRAEGSRGRGDRQDPRRTGGRHVEGVGGACSHQRRVGQLGRGLPPRVSR